MNEHKFYELPGKTRHDKALIVDLRGRAGLAASKWRQDTYLRPRYLPISTLA
jgi:hypothetical protein